MATQQWICRIKTSLINSRIYSKIALTTWIDLWICIRFSQLSHKTIASNSLLPISGASRWRPCRRQEVITANLQVVMLVLIICLLTNTQLHSILLLTISLIICLKRTSLRLWISRFSRQVIRSKLPIQIRVVTCQAYKRYRAIMLQLLKSRISCLMLLERIMVNGPQTLLVELIANSKPRCSKLSLKQRIRTVTYRSNRMLSSTSSSSTWVEASLLNKLAQLPLKCKTKCLWCTSHRL